MPRQVTPAKIYRQRRDNYCCHFEQRRLFKALPVEMQLLYQKWAAILPRPVLNAWGAGIYREEEWTQIAQLAANKNLPDAFLLVPWYVSEEGWQIFQEEWQKLPDAIFLPPDEPLWIKEQVFRLVHNSTALGIEIERDSTGEG